MSRSEYDANQALARMDIDSPMVGGIRHADQMEPPLQARDGWLALATVAAVWASVFFVAPFAYGLGYAVVKIYLV